jgi:hypothetical protein
MCYLLVRRKQEMDINTFGMEVIAEIGKTIGPEYRMNISEFPKNNGLIKHGLSIMTRYLNLSPCIYLDEFYDLYLSGEMSVSEVAETVLQIYRKNMPEHDFDTTSFTDYNKAKKNLRFRLVNTEKNQELLKEIPHRDYLDLSLIYTVEFSCEKLSAIGSIQVRNEHMKMWGVDETQLFLQAKKNMESTDESSIENMENIMERLSREEDLQCEEDLSVPMYILSNKRRHNGAVQMLDKNALKAASELLGEEFIILPSSVHELLLIPQRDDEQGVEELVQLVQAVNDTQVAPNEILSYHVYQYSSQADEITIVA